MRKFRNFLLKLAVVGGPVSALAQGEGSSTAFDVGTAITDIQSGMTGIIGQLKAPAIAIVLAGVAIWVIPKLVSYLKTAFQAGKGR